MSQLNPNSRKQLEYAGWPSGVDSYSSPLAVIDGKVRWAVNAVNRSGVWTTRPGFKTRQSFAVVTNAPRVFAQGFTWFTPTGGGTQLIWAISGNVWYAPIAPDGSVGDAVMMSNVTFNPNAAQVTFARCVQTATVVNGIPATPIPARNILIIQDGTSRPAYWDGTTSGTLNPQVNVVVDGSGNTTYPADYNQTRAGLWMAWSGNRLFVARGPNVYASDLGDPTHFTEMLVLTSLPVISLPTDVTGMIDRGTSGTTNSQVIIFCRNETYAAYSGVQQRIPSASAGYPGWQGTPNFLSKIFAGTGCVAGKTPVNHRGLIYWLSEWGLVMFDNINSVTSTQNMPAINAVMAYSNRAVSNNQTLACHGFYNSYVFWGMTGAVSGSGNTEIQVLDRQPMPVDGAKAFAWQGVWTGISPVEFATCEVSGITRCYALSDDGTGVIRIIEAFQANRADNGHPIPWGIETPLHMVSGGVFDRANFLYARMFLDNIYGNLDIVCRWRGTRGVWHEILTTRVTATPGRVLTPYDDGTGPQSAVLRGSNLEQARDILTRNVRGEPGGCQSAAVEARGDAMDNSDRAFALRFEFRGRGSLIAYRIAADNFEQDTEGEAVGAETGFHVLPGAGCPQFIEGDTPEYILADDNPAGNIIPNGQTPVASRISAGDTSSIGGSASAINGNINSSYVAPNPPFVNLANLAWQFPCQGSDQPGVCFTVAGASNGTFFNAPPGLYNVSIRIAGVAETNVYSGGTQVGGFYFGGGPDGSVSGGNIYSLVISDPPQTIFLNNAASLFLQAVDVTGTFQARAGAQITLVADSADGIQLSNSLNFTVPNVPNVTQPYDGQFLVMQVQSVTPA